MIIATQATLAMRCPGCGKLEFHSLSRFAFSGRKPVQITCSCGELKLIISPKRKGGYLIQVRCIFCENMHLHVLKNRLLWSKKVIELFCQDTDIKLGYIGPFEKVRQLTNNQEEVGILFNKLACEDYFRNSEIMHHVLTYIYDLAEQGLLYCQCGNYNIQVDIFSERLELRCKNCSAVSVIYSETEEDLNLLQQVDEIELIQNSFMFLGNTTQVNRRE